MLNTVLKFPATAGVMAALPDYGQDDWEGQLDRIEGSSRPLNNANNVAIVLRCSDRWKGMVWFNSFTNELMCGKRGWIDSDTTQLQAWLQSTGGFKTITRNTIDDGIKIAGEERRVNKLTEYLDGLVWDGQKRIYAWLTDYFGVGETPLNCAFGELWLISAVARAFEPGCQVDHCLILEGQQGIRKSTALKALAGEEFFAEFNVANLADKDASSSCCGKWILEFSELGAIKSNKAESVKAFMTRASDHYRPPYGRHAETFKRTCVFAGTTNESHYLEDDTGNRRYWPVKCKRAEVEKLKRDRDLLWAEAVYAYREKGVWHLDQPMEKLAREAQQLRMTSDPWLVGIRGYLEGKIDIAAEDVLAKGLDKKDLCPRDYHRVSKCLRTIGWVLYTTTDGKNHHRWRVPSKLNHRKSLIEDTVID